MTAEERCYQEKKEEPWEMGWTLEENMGWGCVNISKGH